MTKNNNYTYVIIVMFRDHTYICNDKNNNYSYVIIVMFRDHA
jgi:hypothetical protein